MYFSFSTNWGKKIWISSLIHLYKCSWTQKQLVLVTQRLLSMCCKNLLVPKQQLRWIKQVLDIFGCLWLVFCVFPLCVVFLMSRNLIMGIIGLHLTESGFEPSPSPSRPFSSPAAPPASPLLQQDLKARREGGGRAKRETKNVTRHPKRPVMQQLTY